MQKVTECMKGCGVVVCGGTQMMNHCSLPPWLIKQLDSDFLCLLSQGENEHSKVKFFSSDLFSLIFNRYDHYSIVLCCFACLQQGLFKRPILLV